MLIPENISKAEPAAPMIEATNIVKSYGALQVLKGITLSIGKGEIVSIVGASGAGKTTLLTILGTLDNPDGGTLVIDGQAIHGMKSKQLAAFRNRRIGFVFQFHHLLPEFTALENVCIPALIARSNKKDAENKALGLLRMLGVESRAKHKPSELSGGEQQRVAVARALMNDPAVILADEPSGNLDSVNAKNLHELFFQLRKELNHTFVIVTHNDELAAMADRKLVMKDGVIV
ncbi:MAG: antimicrobial peptide ABC transporter ATPase [Bacteroidetes bacterium]|nr:MAG: antimicrobial peptide ABC transporter ATPase [Bacteroidota bacterium]